MSITTSVAAAVPSFISLLFVLLLLMLSLWGNLRDENSVVEPFNEEKDGEEAGDDAGEGEDPPLILNHVNPRKRMR